MTTPINLHQCRTCGVDLWTVPTFFALPEGYYCGEHNPHPGLTGSPARIPVGRAAVVITDTVGVLYRVEAETICMGRSQWMSVGRPVDSECVGLAAKLKQEALHPETRYRLVKETSVLKRECLALTGAGEQLAIAERAAQEGQAA